MNLAMRLDHVEAVLDITREQRDAAEEKLVKIKVYCDTQYHNRWSWSDEIRKILEEKA